MNKKQLGLLSVLVWALSAIGIIIFAFSTNKDGKIGTFVNYGVFLTIVSILITLLFSLLNIFKSPELLKKALTSVGILIVILVLAYLLSDSNEVLDAAGNTFEGSKGSVSKWIGTSINYSIILIIVSGGLFLWDMFKNAIK